MSTIREAAETYINDLDALKGMLKPVLAVSENLSIRFRERHLKALEEHGEEIESDGQWRKFKVPPEHIRKVRRTYRLKEQYETSIRLLPRTFLVSFVSAYDAYLGNLVHALFESKPEALNSSGKQLTYKELTSFADLSSARTHVVASEVETLLRKSHAEQFDWLEKTFNIKLREGLDSWPAFIELTERRNLFVHCHGKISSQYLKVCLENGVDTSSHPVGTTIDAERSYLVESYKCLYEIGVKLSQVLWRKIGSDDIENADSALMSITYDLLQAEEYDLANRLLTFAIKLPRHSTEARRRIFLVNLAQSYKFLGKQDKCLSTLSTLDWSACSDNFSVCVHALKDQFPEAAAAMKRVGSDGQIKKHDYIDWPIFKDFRQSNEFKSAYQEIFGVEPTSLLTHSTNRKEVVDTDASEIAI